MNLEGRRESKNVDDRRGKVTKTAGLGIGGLLIAGIIYLFTGTNVAPLVQQMGGRTETVDTEYVATAEEQELAKFASQILAGTEDVWTAEFKKMGAPTSHPSWCCSRGLCRAAAATPHRQRVRSTVPLTNVCISTWSFSQACTSNWEPTATSPMPMS